MYFDVQIIGRLAQTCKLFRDLMAKEDLWKRVLFATYVKVVVIIMLFWRTRGGVGYRGNMDLQ
jgi:hypothetical protein